MYVYALCSGAHNDRQNRYTYSVQYMQYAYTANSVLLVVIITTGKTFFPFRAQHFSYIFTTSFFYALPV